MALALVAPRALHLAGRPPDPQQMALPRTEWAHLEKPVTAPATTMEDICSRCGQPKPVTPRGLIARHYDNQLPASARHCPGGRHMPAGNDNQETT